MRSDTTINTEIFIFKKLAQQLSLPTPEKAHGLFHFSLCLCRKSLCLCPLSVYDVVQVWWWWHVRQQVRWKFEERFWFWGDFDGYLWFQEKLRKELLSEHENWLVFRRFFDRNTLFVIQTWSPTSFIVVVSHSTYEFEKPFITFYPSLFKVSEVWRIEWIG